MYDKTVRRRRAVLGLLVACSLVLLTASFGAPAGGVLHGVQRGASQVLNPIQSVASTALKPVRDLFDWVGGTFTAKSEVKDLRAQVATMRTQMLTAESDAAENARLRKLVELDTANGLQQYGLVTGRVIVRSPTVWYSTVRVNAGSSRGVKVGQPVVNEQALIGHVTDVFGGSAEVTLITDTTSSVQAFAGPRRIYGVVHPASAGDPNDLILDDAASTRIAVGDHVVTSGTVPNGQNLPSLYPAGLPIGQVTRIDNAGTDTQEVHLRPFADMSSLQFVQVLTRPRGTGQ